MLHKALILSGVVAALTLGAQEIQPEKRRAAETVWNFAAGG
jgi:hypothetical protein